MDTSREGVKDELSRTRQGVSRGMNGHNGKNTKTFRNKFSEISTFMADPNLFTALEKVGNDKEALRQAKANPITYLQGEGLVLPRGTDVKIMYSKGKPQPKPRPNKVTLDLQFTVGSISGTLKGTITFE